MVYDHNKPPLDEDLLVHYGVPGMKWGHHKARNDAPNPKYTRRLREADAQVYGRRGSARINRRMNDGKTHKQAETTEARQKLAKAAAIAAGVYAAKIIIENQGQISYAAVNHINTKRGAEAARNILADNKGIASAMGPAKFSPVGRNGVIRIRS